MLLLHVLLCYSPSLQVNTVPQAEKPYPQAARTAPRDGTVRWRLLDRALRVLRANFLLVALRVAPPAKKAPLPKTKAQALAPIALRVSSLRLQADQAATNAPVEPTDTELA